MEIIKDIPYNKERDHRNCYDLYIPDGGASVLVIYFYGGSLKKGCKDTQKFPAKLCDRGYAVACPDYRLIPEVKYPDFIVDAAGAVNAVIADYTKKYGKPEKTVIGGHSAGAYLSMMLCFDKKYLAEYGIDADGIDGYLLISGQPTKHMSILQYEGEDKRRIVVDDTSAMYHLRSHGAPLLIVTSDLDLPNRREQNVLMYTALKTFEYDAPVTFVNLGAVEHGKMMRADDAGEIPAMKPVIEFLQGL